MPRRDTAPSRPAGVAAVFPAIRQRVARKVTHAEDDPRLEPHPTGD